MLAGMPKRTIQRFMPDGDTIRNHKHLQCFGHLLHKAGLWRLNRRSVAMAVAVGLFFAFVPVPFQMMLAAGGAIFFNANMPISVGMVWLTNPVTMPPVFYVCYLVGAWVLGIPTGNFDFELSWQWLASGLLAIWKPFLLGCFLLGLLSAVLGYLGMNLTWRFMVLRRWHRRHSLRAA